ncbi:monocarboxylate transporter 5-like isoform X3 [Andrena cerasifolii]|uniref:monocarboxylate transporter 5-like isoform X3 n=1 Tax=Andrena cerasifolii TaxID=2819439 RepID=UPI00403825AE
MAHAAVRSSAETNKQEKKSASENAACESMDHPLVSDQTQPLPPDGGWGWFVVLASFLIHVITDGVTYSFGLFYLELLYYFEDGKGATAWIASILVGVTLCSGPISGWFVDKYGCRIVTVAGSILASLCLLCSMWARNIVTLYFTIGIGTGFGFGLIYLPAIVSVTSYFEKYRSLATGIAVCGSGLGTLVFAPCLEYLIATYGWRGSIMLCSGIVLNCIVLGLFFRPIESRNQRKKSSPERPSQSTTRRTVEEGAVTRAVTFQKEKNSVRVTSARSQPVLNSKNMLHQSSLEDIHKEMFELKVSPKQKIGSPRKILDISILKDPVFILFTLSNFCTSIGFYVPYVYVLPQAEEQGINKKDASYLLAVIGIANTIGRIILGYISDKPWVNRLLVYNLCLTICGISTILSILCTTFTTFALFSSVFGFTSGAYVGLTSVILVDLLGMNRLTNAFGLLLLFQGFASLLGPPIAGWLYDALETYNPGFFTAGGMITLSGLILFFIPLVQRKIQENVNNQVVKTAINNEPA